MSSVVSYWRQLDDRYYIVAKLLFFTVNLPFYAFYLFRTSFFQKYLFLDQHEIGAIMAGMYLTVFVSSSFWTFVADKTRRPKALILFLAMAMALSAQLYMVPVGLVKSTKEDTPDLKQKRFWFYFFVSIVATFFRDGLMPLMDNAVLRMLSSRPGMSKEMYGRQRLFGTLGFAVISLAVSYLLKGTKDNYQILFLSILGLAGMFIAIMALFGPEDRPNERRASEDVESKTLPKAVQEVPLQTLKTVTLNEKTMTTPAASTPSPLLQLLRNPNYVFLLVVVFINGFARAFLSVFLSAFHETQIEMSKDLVAVAANMGIVMEVVTFFFSKRVMDAIGVYWMLIVAQCAIVLRLWAYSIIPHAQEMIVPVMFIELLKGVNFVFMHSSGVKIAQSCAPRELQSLAQGVYSGVFGGLAAAVGSAAGGAMKEFLGTRMTFIIISILSTAALGLFLVKYAMFDGVIMQNWFGPGTAWYQWMHPKESEAVNAFSTEPQIVATAALSCTASVADSLASRQAIKSSVGGDDAFQDVPLDSHPRSQNNA